MGLAMFLFAAVDTQAKFLTSSLDPIQIVWTRQLGLLVAVFGFLVWKGHRILATAHPILQITRGAVAVGSATLFITGISFVPLADAIAVTFIAPFIVTVLGAVILREKVGFRRWAAVAIGFLGTLIVIRPGMGVVHPAVLLVMAAAALFSVRQIISRYLAADDRTITTVAYTALVGSALLTIPLPFVWQWPLGTLEIALCCGIAILAGVAELLVIKALEVAEAVVVAPVHYSIMVWGTMYGWLVFHQLPDFWTWVGTAIIIATGVYTIHRERLAARKRA